MKFVYLLKSGQLNNRENRFEFYEFETFSSEKKALRSIENRIDVNNGYAVTKEEVNSHSRRNSYLEVTYNCMSAPCVGEEAKPMRIRYCLYKKELQ
jgi:hypothetical protein